MSRLPFEIILALRYLRPKRTFVSVITLISVIGVMLGAAVLIIVISVMSGFDRQLRDKILGFNAHVRVTGAGSTNTLQDYATPAKLIAEIPEVKAVAPYVLGQVLVETQPAEGSALVAAPWVRGVDPKLESSVSILPRSIVEGTNSLRGATVWIGSDFAMGMKLSVGDKLSIFSTRNFNKMRQSVTNHTGEAVLPDEFEISGIFDAGYYEYNASILVTSIANAQDLYGLGDAVHGLIVKLQDPYKAEEVRQTLRATLGPDYLISTWTDENSGLLDALMVEKNVMFYLMFFITIVAAFGITSTLITFVVQKTREIGMLKALGATSGQLLWLFLSQGLLVGVLGVSAGLGLGILGVTYRNEFLSLMRKLTGYDLFSKRIYNFSELPAMIVTSDIAVICVCSLAMCILAGLIPAWTASRLRPVEALRHE